LIVYGNVLFEGNMTFTNTNLLITGSLHTKGNVTLNNSRMFSNGDALTEGNVFSSGSSTLASGGSLTVKGNVEHTNPGTDVGLLMMSVGAFSVPGNMEKGGLGGQLLHGIVWAGGTADVSGNAALRGGIASVGNLTITGNATVDGRANLINNDLPNNSQLAVLSRR
jgi:formylmethanofuran dehydrogenase subunit C